MRHRFGRGPKDLVYAPRETGSMLVTFPPFTVSMVGTDFDPSQLSGATAWFRPDRNVVSGATLTWTDSIGGYVASQTVSGNQPTLIATDSAYNNKSTFSFASANKQFFSWAFKSLPQPFTVYVVGNSSGTSQQEFFGDATNDTCIVYQGSGPGWGIYAGTGAVGTGNTTQTKQVFCAVFNGASSAFYINNSGTVYGTGNPGTAGLLVAEFIGASSPTGANPLNGKIAEFVVCSGTPASGDVGKYFTYASAEFGGSWS